MKPPRFIFHLALTGAVFAGFLTLSIIGCIKLRGIRSICSSIISAPEKLPSNKVESLYVLGGAGGGYKKLINRAADLYRSGLTDRILLYKSEAMWRYDTTLKRNITKNEGEIQRLVDHGVLADHVDLVPINEGFFGTLSEAKDLSDYLAKKGSLSVILVAASGHTRRVSLCFGYYLRKKNIAMYIAHSEGEFSPREIAAEMIKLPVYQAIVLWKSFSS